MGRGRSRPGRAEKPSSTGAAAIRRAGWMSAGGKTRPLTGWSAFSSGTEFTVMREQDSEIRLVGVAIAVKIAIAVEPVRSE